MNSTFIRNIIIKRKNTHTVYVKSKDKASIDINESPETGGFKLPSNVKKMSYEIRTLMHNETFPEFGYYSHVGIEKISKSEFEEFDKPEMKNISRLNWKVLRVFYKNCKVDLVTTINNYFIIIEIKLTLIFLVYQVVIDSH